MPIYEFRCFGCDEVFELLEMKQEDREHAKCPKCGSISFERIMSRTNFAVSGSQSCSGTTGTSVNERTCGEGKCTTVTLPGPK